MKEQLNQLSVYQPSLSPRALKEKHGIEGGLYKLAPDENLYGPSPKVKETILAHLDELYYYPETGSLTSKAAINKHLNVDQPRILFGVGSDEAILMISRTVLTPGDTVATSEATSGQYYHNMIVKSASMIQIPLEDGGFDLGGILKEVNDSTSLIWLCNPSNPTGMYFNHESLDSFLSQTLSCVPILIDEAYFEFVIAEDYPNTLTLQQRYNSAFLLHTSSKTYGLAGSCMGCVIVSEHAVEEWNIIRPPLGVTRISEHAIVATLGDQQYLKEMAYKNSIEREGFYRLPRSEYFSLSQMNFIFVKIKRVDKPYGAPLNIGCITRPFSTGIRIIIGFKE